jgi:hypothetical protein
LPGGCNLSPGNQDPDVRYLPGSHTAAYGPPGRLRGGRVQRSRRAFLLVSRILFAGSAQPHCRARQSSYLTMRARIGSPGKG